MSDAQVRFSPADAAAEVRRYGSTILRQAWRPEHLGRIREAIVRFNALRSEQIANGVMKPSAKMLHTHGAGTFPQLVADRLLSPSILSEMFVGSDYRAMCVEYFQDDALYLSPSRLAFRIHDPNKSDRTFVPYHQDSGSQDPRIRGVLNCWIPLDPGAGREAPGLEVVREPSSPNFPIKDFGWKSENAVYDPVTIDSDAVQNQFGDNLLAPVFDLGDGFVFSQDVIHRTYVTPEMTKPRINFEFRVFSLKHLAHGASAEAVLREALRVA
jgi:hypothetical protein